MSSFSVAAAEQVCGQERAVQDERTAGNGQHMLEQLSSLVDKSMVQCLEQEQENMNGHTNPRCLHDAA